MTNRCISGSVPPKIKFQRLYPSPMSLKGKYFNGPHANLVRWFLYPEIQDHPKTGSSFILARVVVFEGYLSRLLCFSVRQIECHYFYLDYSHLDAIFQDGGRKAPQPYCIWDRLHAYAVSVMCKTQKLKVLPVCGRHLKDWFAVDNNSIYLASVSSASPKIYD